MRTKLDFLLWICFFVLFVACEDHPQEPDIVAVTSVTLNESALSLKEGRNVTLSATITPDDATNQNVIWKSSDPDIATVDTNGKIRALNRELLRLLSLLRMAGKLLLVR